MTKTLTIAFIVIAILMVATLILSAADTGDLPPAMPEGPDFELLSSEAV